MAMHKIIFYFFELMCRIIIGFLVSNFLFDNIDSRCYANKVKHLKARIYFCIVKKKKDN